MAAAKNSAPEGSGDGQVVQVHRIYDDAEPRDGQRVLVDRIWPRGISKERADLDDWCRQVAPSTELRRWYGHDPEKFEEFSKRYRKELDSGARAQAYQRLRDLADTGRLTLLTASKRDDISEATVLADRLNRSLRASRAQQD